jgi:hypothetical protein
MGNADFAENELIDDSFIRILFWNTKGKNLDDAISCLVSDLEVNVILLAESPTNPAFLASSLRASVDSRFFAPIHIKNKFVCAANDESLSLNELVSEEHFSLRRFIHDSHSSVLVTIHAIDAINHDLEHRSAQAQVVLTEIKSLLNSYQSDRVVIIGDFNVNPFDRCMTLPMVFNAMMTRSCTKNGRRQYQRKKYDLYYNPMWSFFGDLSNGPSGTFYYTGSRGIFGWNMLDQVILHHSLASYFHSVKIVDSTTNLNLADARGRPNDNCYSDHFPILITLKRKLL